ncbi:MAG: type II toxin-antitoxin system HicB family antitoxin [Oscillospiraceae bacterium]|nr:type II toxin-antitoxin system HicB family antitoxin [Oscillospiraceae bacterium]
MNNIIQYKGYVGSVEFSENDGLLFGKVQGIRSVISYEGTTVSELIEDFHGAVDDYISQCEEEGIKPETPYKGSLNIRFRDPDTHRRVAVYAMSHDQTINGFIDDCVVERLNALHA